MKSKKQLKKSKKQTDLCIKCFKPIETNSLRYLGLNCQKLCKNCLNEREPIFEVFNIEGVKCMALYPYNDALRSTLFTLKGCGDIVLARAFLSPYEFELSVMYHGYFIVPAPSYFQDDLDRGFNHVEEIYKSLKLPILKLFRKKEKIKQSDLDSEKRMEVINNLELVDKNKIVGKKILIVDDVLTTGSTVKAMIKLIKEHKPKDIKVLVSARTSLPKKHK